MRLSFPYQYFGQTLFGDLYRPYAQLNVLRKKPPINWIERTMIVDTGADYTIFPFSDSFIFGVDCKKECKKEETYGVGGKKTVYLYKNLTVRLGTLQRIISVGFLEDSSIPALLGRQQFLDLFNITFSRFVTTFSDSKA